MKSRKKRWYVVALIVQATVQGREEKRPLYDRQIRLLRAPNHAEAYAKALALGKEETQSYVNPKRK